MTILTTPGTDMNVPAKWPLERVLFALAGTMTLLGVVLAVAVSPWFLLPEPTARLVTNTR